MKNILLIVFSISTALFSKSLYAQSPSEAESLLCRTWVLNYFEENGERKSPDKDQLDDKMIFNKDHTLKSIEGNTVETGTWSYDGNTKNLKIFVEGDTMIFKVEKLNATECILKIEDTDGSYMRMSMVPAAEK